MLRIQVRFSGRVQGVGFRATARSIARHHSITGWVRNEPDGSVLLEAQGHAAAVRAFLDALASRMSGHITHQAESPAPAAPTEDGFQIRS
jgi:acylphosphatase